MLGILELASFIVTHLVFLHVLPDPNMADVQLPGKIGKKQLWLTLNSITVLVCKYTNETEEKSGGTEGDVNRNKMADVQ